MMNNSNTEHTISVTMDINYTNNYHHTDQNVCTSYSQLHNHGEYSSGRGGRGRGEQATAG